MSLVKAYKQFMSNPNALEQAFGAFEASSVTDTADFRSMVKSAEMSKEVTVLRTDEGETLTVTKVLDQRPSPIHPAPSEFTPEQLETDPILRFFHYDHLPERLRVVSQPFCELAHHIVTNLPRTPERTVALRKMLEAKDAAVRSAV